MTTPDKCLKGTKWANWLAEPLAGDASSRQYHRLFGPTPNTAILMQSGDASSLTRYQNLTYHLQNFSLRVPEIYLSDIPNGCLVIEDFGDTNFAQWINDHPSDEGLLYQKATDVAVHLSQVEPCNGLAVMTPKTAGEMVGLCVEFYAPQTAANSGDILQTQIETAIATHCGPPTTFSHRDYHAENLHWLPNATPHNQVGLIDFQDAFLAPAGYDIASLLCDARRDVDAKTSQQIVSDFSARTGVSMLAISTLAVQRNLRILGIFARLSLTSGKPRYLDFIPRIWNHICQDLQHSELSDLRKTVHELLPEPTSSHLNTLRTK